MKTIEELSLENIVQIEKYLSGKMSNREANAFEEKLRRDEELCDDFEMINEEINKKGKSLRWGYNPYSNPQDRNVVRMERKRQIGKTLTGNGFLALAVMLIMVAICAVMIAVAG
ncbi:hypothetical protein R9C00_01185 [Flammeovirgaceae bacterium SG7u.111]|nr:hypothetical protein [Flammeovirgaceae bacterium SG7u.132]WPO36062.1 hypothetical protein R9C00_01185 [Flammeovirgaceae bacterium SG7u.111]